MVGADLTTPSSTMATCFPTYFAAIRSNAPDPLPVKFTCTDQSPERPDGGIALAVATTSPRSSAGPRRYRPLTVPSELSSGSTTVWLGSSCALVVVGTLAADG